ncbi:CAP domain-containing protein [Undibacterium sp. Di24W]|uniref:CAP domain-containing protein n=1 Tax=Undibacterium sp. Di24W TaxID=3413033 RepID=UPI003BF216E5
MKSIKFFLPAVLIFSAGLSACGGGGSGSSTTPTTPTTPVAQTCSNGATDFPNCIIIPASLQKPSPANYAAGSLQADVFTALNEFRTSIGLGPLNQNPLLDKAALNHTNYAITSWIPGEDPHLEVAGRVNFTGVGFLDRYRAVGFTNAVGGGEVLAAPSGKDAILPLANAILHR